jgi:hypothetical protein
MLNALLTLPAGVLTAVNGATGVSDIEGKAAREAVSEWGQRASFNGANGMSEQPLVAAVPATPKLGEGRSARICPAKMAGAPIAASGFSLPKTNCHGRYWLNFRCLVNAMSLTS